MNNIFKNKARVDLDNNHYLETDSNSGVVLVQHFPAKKKDKEGKEVSYTKFERFYYPTVASCLERYTREKQIILPEVTEMLEIQKQVLAILEDFKTKFKNWN